MKFQNEREIAAAISKMPKTTSGRLQCSVMFKKAMCEYLEATDGSLEQLCNRVGLKNQTVYAWRIQYRDGLYTEEGTYSVSLRMKDANEQVLAILDKELQTIQKKIDAVKLCQSLGLKVSE